MVGNLPAKPKSLKSDASASLALLFGLVNRLKHVWNFSERINSKNAVGVAACQENILSGAYRMNE